MIEKVMRFLVSIFFGVFFQVKKNPISPDLQKACLFYESDGFIGLFAKIRVWDAPFEEIEKLVPKKGTVLDLGCGDGLLANYLALSASDRKIIGVEINSERLKEANRGVKNVTFKQGDVTKLDYPFADAILLVHVLHHLSAKEEQMVLLKKCKSRLRPGGRLIIVEISKKPLIKFLITWVTDAVIFPMLFEHKVFNNFFYRKEKQWEDLLKELEFKVKIIAAHQNKPFSHVIFLAIKK